MKMVLRCCMVSLLMGITGFRHTVEAQPADPRIAATKPAVVRVEVNGQDSQAINRTNLGTGFFFTADGYILTAAHVLRTEAGWAEDPTGQSRWTVIVKNNSRTWNQAAVLYSDPQTDLALLRVDTSGAPVPHLELGDSSVVSDGAYIIGFGYDTNVVPYRGDIATTFDSRYLGVFRMNIPAQRGDSGGPVVGDDGKVIGIILAGLTDRPGRVYAVPINLASNLAQFTRPPNAVSDSNRVAQECATRLNDVEKRLQVYGRAFSVDDQNRLVVGSLLVSQDAVVQGWLRAQLARGRCKPVDGDRPSQNFICDEGWFVVGGINSPRGNDMLDMLYCCSGIN